MRPGTFDAAEHDERARELAAKHFGEIVRRTDRLFGALLLVEWIAGIAVALVVSPRTWTGTASAVHPHVWTAIVLGAVTAGAPGVLALAKPDRAYTRFVVAIAQMLWSALLIHVTGGRIETHFHAFGSLAFLAFYRDWRVLLTGSVVISIDHLARGMMYPESVFGVAMPGIWRAVEHAWWIVFEDVFLLAACLRGRREIDEIAARHASLEQVHQLEVGLRAAQEASRAKSEFLANMSHEIRTPMTAVQGFADLLLTPGLDEHERIAHVQTIRRSGDHLLSIINDILDLSKIEAGHCELERVACSPLHVVGDVAALMRMRALDKGLAFTVTVRGRVPAQVVGDPTRLRQILVNLVGNAIKFTETGAVEIVVSHDPIAST
ncbi:MAG TPA: histidine kinase dimerization/phospho-acceptor domain-containing protein, partial [Nannocystaceae bacterium]|nr:histidine kinase dimerization/phospho-acceptor domain-containing protein [Nannocystaceae bacterium]